MEVQSSETVDIVVQLGASMLLVVICTVIHALGLAGASRFLNLEEDRLKEHDFDLSALMLMCGMALCLFLLHMLEITVFAIFYLLVGAVASLEEALHYSASTYATLGRTADYFPDDWALMGAIEALIGFLLIGWSTAFIVRNVNRLAS
jgi:Ca2+/Na+ antiporter